MPALCFCHRGYVRCLRNSEGANDRLSFFMISGDGPCRLGQYPYLIRQVLDENGYSGVPLFTPSQDQTFYDQFGIVPAVFKRRAWQGTVAVDLLYRKWRECRPYVTDRDLLDKTYRGEIQKIADCLEEGIDLAEQLGRSFDNLEKTPQQNIPPPPIIAVLERIMSAAIRSLTARLPRPSKSWAPKSGSLLFSNGFIIPIRLPACTAAMKNRGSIP